MAEPKFTKDEEKEILTGTVNTFLSRSIVNGSPAERIEAATKWLAAEGVQNGLSKEAARTAAEARINKAREEMKLDKNWDKVSKDDFETALAIKVISESQKQLDEAKLRGVLKEVAPGMLAAQEADVMKQRDKKNALTAMLGGAATSAPPPERFKLDGELAERISKSEEPAAPKKPELTGAQMKALSAVLGGVVVGVPPVNPPRLKLETGKIDSSELDDAVKPKADDKSKGKVSMQDLRDMAQSIGTGISSMLSAEARKDNEQVTLASQPDVNAPPKNDGKKTMPEGKTV